jgi:ribonuclease VapC
VSDEYALDASALICLINQEKGFERVGELLPKAIISAVNLAEVIAKLQERGGTDNMIDETIADFNVPVIDFDSLLAIRSGKLRNATRSQGLSLGDRACLALALERDATAVTTDKAWGELQDIARVLVVR